MIPKFIRQHGLQAPLHALQVSSWILALTNIIGSYCVIVPTLPSNPQVFNKQLIFIILYGISIAFTILLTYKASKSDPTDEIVYIHRSAIKKG